MQIEKLSPLESDKEKDNECAICLQPCVHAVRLPCSHIFCYLCVKGAAHQSKRCAICRTDIPLNYFENPILIDRIDRKDVPIFDDHYQWLYEGRNGWWIYDVRTSQDIEKAFKSNHSKCELLIAGFLYVIDFHRMIQYRRNEPNRIRRIRRDRPDPSLTKGVAGLKTDLNDVIQQDSSHSSLPTSNESSESSGSEENTRSDGDQVVETNEVSQTNNNTHQRPQQISSNSASNDTRDGTFEAEAHISSRSNDSHNGSDNPNDGYSQVARLEQLLSANLTLRETRETYL